MHHCYPPFIFPILAFLALELFSLFHWGHLPLDLIAPQYHQAFSATIPLFFPFISVAWSWIILCLSLSFFIARVDSASDSFSLFSIYACKLFCSGPPQCSSCIHQHNSKRIRLTLSSSSSFSFSYSFFVIFIPRANRGVVYMLVLEKIGGFGGFVATGLGRSEHVRRRWVQRLWGED